MKISKNILSLVLIAGVVAAIWGFRGREGALAPLSPKVKGNPQGTVKIVEFIDFECPSCAKSAQLIDDYLQKFPDRLFVEIKYFPLKGHKHGFYSAEVAECVRAQEKFWPFVETAMARQAEWHDKESAKDILLQIAEGTGAARPAIDACLESGKGRPAIEADRAEGERLQIRSTPTLFVNGKRIVGFQLLEQELKTLLGPVA